MVRKAASIFAAQFKSPLIAILAVAAVISVTIGRITDAIVIMVVVLANSTFGATWEFRSWRAVEALKKYFTPRAKVLRNGKEIEIDAAALRISDLVIIEAGDVVAADGVLKEANFLQIDESPLTGESIPVEKQKNHKVLAGTLVVVGRGIFAARKVGEQTEISKIARTVEQAGEVESPLQKRIAKLGLFLAIFLLAISAVTFLVGLVLNYDIFQLSITAVVLTVSAVPEGLPVAVTVVLAIGLWRMAKKKAIVRKLAAAESLGSVTLIAADKTGTLTKGEIAVSKIWQPVNGETLEVANLTSQQVDSNLKKLLITSVLCNDARLKVADGKEQSVGDPIEGALLSQAKKLGVDYRLYNFAYQRLAEFPFDPNVRYMVTLNKVDLKEKLFEGQQAIFVKGAPAEIVNLSDDQIDKEEIFRTAKKLAKAGLRLLAFGYRKIDQPFLPSAGQSITCPIPGSEGAGQLNFLGLVGFADQAREEAPITVGKLKKAGVRVVMVTGDHELTAAAIAEQTGILAEGKTISLEGRKLDRQTVENLNDYSVFARVSPKVKMNLILAYQKQGEIVAMTGDGVNDGPALVTADVGVALGEHGTDVAKEAADLVITDDNLSTIYSALVEGRVIFDNIRKIVLYLVSDSYGVIVLTLGAIFLNFPLPLLPAQILWNNLVKDSFPDIALAFEPAEPEVLTSPPTVKNAQILDFESKFLVFLIGTISGITTLLVYIVSLSFGNLEHARTLTFAALGANTLIYVFAVRSLRHSFWKMSLWSNKFLLFSILFGFGLLLAGVYLPPLQTLFDTVNLGIVDWLVAIGVGIFVLATIEIAKYFFIIAKK